MNQALKQAFPHRTTGAISQHRRPQAHKDLVIQYSSHLRVLPGDTASPLPSPTCGTGPAPGQGEVFSSLPSPSPLLTYLQNLPRVNTTCYQAERLHDIVCDASNSSKSTIFERLSCYLQDVFPPGSPHHRPAAAIHKQQQTRGQVRCRENATTQRHWPSHRMRCIKNFLGDVEDAKQPPRAAMEPYWTTVFIEPATVTIPESTQHPVQVSIASLIKPEEIQADPPWPLHEGPTFSRVASLEPSHWQSSSGSSISSSGARSCTNTWQFPERSSSPRNLMLLCLENSDLSPSPLSLLGSFIRY